MKTTWAAVVVGTLVCPLLGSATAEAEVQVRVAPVAFLLQGGAAAQAAVRVACDPVGGVTVPLEAVLVLTQDEQSIAGDGFINGIVCNGTTRWHSVRVTSFEGTFHRGRGRASAFVLVCDEDGSICEQGQTRRNISLLRFGP